MLLLEDIHKTIEVLSVKTSAHNFATIFVDVLYVIYRGCKQ